MGRLYHTERGRTLIGANEEVTRWRWARKVLRVPAPAHAADADLWLHLGCYEGNKRPLEVELNGEALGKVLPRPEGMRIFEWRKLHVPRGRLRSGANTIILRCDTPAMNAWIISVENGHRDPQSRVSIDRGRTWRNDTMGAHSVLRGEYMIRLRSHAKRPGPASPPDVVYEDSKHPRVKELLNIIPASVRRQRDPWKQILALRTFLAKSWAHDPKPGSYAPWDPWTVIDWGHREWNHGRLGKVTMCVHFGAVMTSCAAALGHKARCVCITREMNGHEGHFMSEVWNDDLGKWVLHDANTDMHYEDGSPLSALDMADRTHAGIRCTPFARRGPGFPKGPAPLVAMVEKWFISGTSFRCSSIWTLNHYVSDPAAAPPNHGSIAYCETDFVWYNPAAVPDDETAMFPYRSPDRAYFDAPPKG